MLERIRTLSKRYILFILCSAIIILYLAFSSGMLDTKYSNVITNILFALLNILATFYITFQIAHIVAKQAFANNQKQLAKTAIRHIRVYLSNIKRLKDIADEKMKVTSDCVCKQYFSEIDNHLTTVIKEISLSQDDFRELVGEELKEEASLLFTIQEDVSKIKLILAEKESLQKQQDKDQNERMQTLNKDFCKLRNDIDSKIGALPFGISGFSTPNILTAIEPLCIDDHTWQLEQTLQLLNNEPFNIEIPKKK